MTHIGICFIHTYVYLIKCMLIYTWSNAKQDPKRRHYFRCSVPMQGTSTQKSEEKKKLIGKNNFSQGKGKFPYFWIEIYTKMISFIYFLTPITTTFNYHITKRDFKQEITRWNT